MCVRYLGWVNQVEGLVEAKVDEAQQCGVELCESGHDSVIHICRVLNMNTHTHTVITSIKKACPSEGVCPMNQHQ